MKARRDNHISIGWYSTNNFKREYRILRNAVNTGYLQAKSLYHPDDLELVIETYGRPKYQQQYSLKLFQNDIIIWQIDFGKKDQPQMLKLLNSKLERLKEKGGEIYYTITQTH